MNEQEARELFAKYSKLSDSKIAELSGVSRGTIGHWKRKLGLTVPRNTANFPTKENLKATQAILEAPANWDSKEWLEEMYIGKGYGTRIIGAMVGKHPQNIHRKLKKYGIITRTIQEATASTNPYCNHTWLYKHYIEMRWSLAKCAECVGCSPSTITNWLIRFKIPIRDTNGTTGGQANQI